MNIDLSQFVSLFVQLPLVGAVIVFTLKLLEQNQTATTRHHADWQNHLAQRDARYLDAMKAMSDDWRNFIKARDELMLQSMREIGDDVKQVARRVEDLHSKDAPRRRE